MHSLTDLGKCSLCPKYKVRAQPAAPAINSIKQRTTTSCYHRMDGTDGAAAAWNEGSVVNGQLLENERAREGSAISNLLIEMGLALIIAPLRGTVF